MSEESASLDTAFTGSALVSVGFYGEIRSLEEGIQVSAAFLLSVGFSEISSSLCVGVISVFFFSS